MDPQYTYLIEMVGGGTVITAGDSVQMDPGGLVVRLGSAVTANLSRGEYLSIGPWVPPVPPRPAHAADPTPTVPPGDPAEVQSVAQGAVL